MRTALTGFVVLVILAAVGYYGIPAAMQMHSLRPPEVEVSAPRTVVPMKHFGRRPLVDVMIEGKGPFPFILDTGAGGSVVNADLARELNLPQLARARVGRPGAAKPVDGVVSRIDRLEIGGVRLKGLGVVVVDLSAMWQGAGTPRGVLSAGSFPGLLVRLDYGREQVELEKGRLPAANGETVFEFGGADPIPTMTLKVAGQLIPVHVDSGSGDGFVLPRRYAAKLPLESEPVEVARSRTVDGDVAVTAAPLQGTVEMGRFSFTHPQIRFAEHVPMGTVGSEILQGFVVTVDWANRRFQLEEVPPPPTANAPRD